MVRCLKNNLPSSIVNTRNEQPRSGCLAGCRPGRTQRCSVGYARTAREAACGVSFFRDARAMGHGFVCPCLGSPTEIVRASYYFSNLVWNGLCCCSTSGAGDFHNFCSLRSVTAFSSRMRVPTSCSGWPAPKLDRIFYTSSPMRSRRQGQGAFPNRMTCKRRVAPPKNDCSPS